MEELEKKIFAEYLVEISQTKHTKENETVKYISSRLDMPENLILELIKFFFAENYIIASNNPQPNWHINADKCRKKFKL